MCNYDPSNYGCAHPFDVTYIADPDETHGDGNAGIVYPSKGAVKNTYCRPCFDYRDIDSNGKGDKDSFKVIKDYADELEKTCGEIRGLYIMTLDDTDLVQTICWGDFVLDEKAGEEIRKYIQKRVVVKRDD